MNLAGSLSLFVDGQEVRVDGLRYALVRYLAEHPEINEHDLESLQFHFGSGRIAAEHIPRRKRNTVRLGHGSHTV